MSRETFNVNNDDTQYEALEAHNNKCAKDKYTQKEPSMFLQNRIYSHSTVGRWRVLDAWSDRDQC